MILCGLVYRNTRYIFS